MKGKIRLELGTLGIIDLDQKRALECYIDERLFRQRKSFSEYYIDTSNEEVSADISDLMLLAEQFKIIVLQDSVILTDN